MNEKAMETMHAYANLYADMDAGALIKLIGERFPRRAKLKAEYDDLSASIWAATMLLAEKFGTTCMEEFNIRSKPVYEDLSIDEKFALADNLFFSWLRDHYSSIPKTLYYEYMEENGVELTRKGNLYYVTKKQKGE